MSKFTHVSFVEELVSNPKTFEEYKGWRMYRIEYLNWKTSSYSLMERGVWLPANFDVRKLEEEINEAISD